MARNILSFISCICCLYVAGSALRVEKEIKAKQVQQEQTIRQILNQAK